MNNYRITEADRRKRELQFSAYICALNESDPAIYPRSTNNTGPAPSEPNRDAARGPLSHLLGY